MKYSFQFRLFFAFACLLFVINLLLTNDYTPYWNGAEIDLLLASQEGTPTYALLPKMKLASLANLFFSYVSSFPLRLPAFFNAVLGLVGFYFFGKKIFGERTVLVTILVLMSSLAFPNLSKWATGDAWLYSSQLLAVTTLILYIKQPKTSTLVWLAIFLVLGSAVNAFSMTLFILPIALFYRFMHSQGTRINKLFVLFIPLIVLIALQVLYNGEEVISGTIVALFSISIKDFSIVSILGILPWIAFLPAALIDMFKKLKKGEEMAILTTGWLIGGLLSMSLGLQAVLAFLVAKQIYAYFHEHYPYGNWVKTFAVLNIIFGFIGGILLMLNGFYALEMEGFRLGMSIGAVYWIPAFLGVVGVFGKNKRMIMGGMALSGLLLTFFFWARGGYVLNDFRKFPSQVITTAASKANLKQLYIIGDDDNKVLQLYANEFFEQVTFTSAETLKPEQLTNNVVILFKDSVNMNMPIPNSVKADTIRGRNIQLQKEKWIILQAQHTLF